MEKALKFKVGDWVIWTLDGDIGLVEDVNPNDDEAYFITWYIEQAASGWHEGCNQLELLGGCNGILL